MPDIMDLNGGIVKALPDATDLLPIQDIGGITKPASIAGVCDAVAISPAVVAAIQATVAAMIQGGAGVTVAYNSTTKKITITAP